MIRHILFWKYTDTVKAEHREAEALAFLQKSVATMVGHIDGLRCAEINTNTAGGEYDLVFNSELRDADALQSYFPIISILGLIPLILFSNSF